jgi:SAM-dependent methyltransferase
MGVGALARWREALEGWAVPEAILATAPEPPYALAVEPLRARAHAALGGGLSSSGRRALEALPEQGAVLDVGVGPGAGSLPLAPYAGRIVGVDRSEDMLTHFVALAQNGGVQVDGVAGSWPEVAERVGDADVVVCIHVLYNVPDLAPFVEALSARARRRVVVELPDRYPWAWTRDLWLHFHGLEVPSGPTAADAAAAFEELGVEARREEEARAPEGGFRRAEDAVAMVRRRLCLPPDSDSEVAEALGSRLVRDGDRWWVGVPERVAVTFWWDP